MERRTEHRDVTAPGPKQVYRRNRHENERKEEHHDKRSGTGKILRPVDRSQRLIVAQDTGNNEAQSFKPDLTDDDRGERQSACLVGNDDEAQFEPVGMGIHSQ